MDVATIDLRTLPSIALAARASLPNIAAIYFVLDEYNTVLYVGQSKALCSRWKQHNRLPQFAKLPSVRIAWLTVSPGSLLPDIEKALIAYFRPACNGRGSDLPYRQTTIRLDPTLLRKARFFLNEEDKSINEFIVEQLAAYVQRREEETPAPRSKDECA